MLISYISVVLLLLTDTHFQIDHKEGKNVKKFDYDVIRGIK